MRGRHGDMVVNPLERGVGPAVIDTDDGCAPHDAAIGESFELGLCGLHPVHRRTAVDLVTLGEQTPAKAEILLAQDHAGARASGSKRGGQARRASAGHQNVAKGVGLLVMVGVWRLCRAPKTRGAADGGLIDLLPEGGRPHEGLVVEARPEDRGEELVRREQIELQRRPPVLARGVEPVIELDGGGAGVGLAAGAVAKLDERVRLLTACGQNPARAMIFEGAPDQSLAAGEKRGRQRIAGMA